MQRIEFDFRIKEEQERHLTEIADRLHQVCLTSFEYAEQELRQGWQSENSIQFLNKLKDYGIRLADTERDIRRAVQALQDAGKKAAYMEKRAKEICGE